MKYKKIYMITPPNYVTGGVEASFQIADAINNQGGECYTIFSDPSSVDPIPSEYKRYNVKISNNIDPTSENLIIVPEIWPHILDTPELKTMGKAIWWLSVDHNRGSSTNFDSDVIHLYQSDYARDFLSSRGAKTIIPIFDYLSDEYFAEYNINEKENTICYSIKGKDLAESLKSYLPEYKFTMLIGMTRLEVIDTLRKSKVFIDFGYHPGKDRIPREAAMLHNCVITNRKGSANYEKDIPILDMYKIESENIHSIADQIKDCIENYEERTKDFDSYRKEIRNQKTEFTNQVKLLF